MVRSPSRPLVSGRALTTFGLREVYRQHPAKNLTDLGVLRGEILFTPEFLIY
jgi:hypothetical protein